MAVWLQVPLSFSRRRHAPSAINNTRTQTTQTITMPPPEMHTFTFITAIAIAIRGYFCVYTYDGVPPVDRAAMSTLLGTTLITVFHSALGYLQFSLGTFHRYVVTFDGARGLSAGNALTLSCTGSANDCGCIDVTGAVSGPRAVGCGEAGSAEETAASSRSKFDSSACRVQAAVELETLRGGGETVVNGGGVLSFSDGGQYFLPSAVAADVVVGEAEVVCPQWAPEVVGAVTVSAGGVLWFAG